MADKYIQSENIKVFPFAKYRAENIDLGSRLFYELNISRLITQITDTDGFIISGDISNTGLVTATGPLCFNIHGYYFEVSANTDLASTFENSTKIYGKIIIGSQNNNVPELQYQDEYGKFKALTLTDTVTDSDIYLLLAEKIDDNWQLVKDSFTKIYPKSLKISKIDGKI